MKQISTFVFASSLLFFMLNCSDEKGITEITEGEIIFSSNQVSGCNNNLGLAKTSPNDSCFTYNFDETLKIDFCVFGNCCPDSKRFDANYTLSADTIFVEVIDTAANLCYCICNYTVHVELSGLQRDNYLFYCNFPAQDSMVNFGHLKYRENVYRDN